MLQLHSAESYLPPTGQRSPTWLLVSQIGFQSQDEEKAVFLAKKGDENFYSIWEPREQRH